MRLTQRDVARLLATQESTVQRWVDQAGLPAADVGGQLRFNREAVLEWAAMRGLPISPIVFEYRDQEADAACGLEQALRAGGVVADVPGADRRAVLSAMVERLALPASYDRADLIELLLARESVGSTAIGDGLAIPHPRLPMVVRGAEVRLQIGFLRQPLEFGARDGRPVDTLFVVIAPSVSAHLLMLAKLVAALGDTRFREVVRRRAAADVILGEARRLDMLAPRSDGLGGA